MTRKLFLVCVSTFVSFVLIEGFLRTAFAEKFILLNVCGIKVKFQGWLADAGYYKFDSVLGYSGLPNASVRFPNTEHLHGAVSNTRNNLGLVGSRNTSIQKPKDVFRILVLGDSQAEGLSLCDSDETFPHVLELLLTRSGKHPRIESLNAGVSGYSPWQYFLWYKRYGQELKPDLIIMSFYVGNDVVETNRLSIMRSLRLYEELSSSSSRLLFLSRASSVDRRLGIELPIANLSDSWRPGIDKHTGHIFAQSLLQNYFQKAFPGQFTRALNTDLHILRLMDEEVRRSKTRWMLLLIPSKFQVEPEDDAAQAGKAMNLLGLSERELTADRRIEKAVAAFCNANHVPCLDMTSAMAVLHREKKQRLFGRLHWHLNPEGQLRTAMLLESYLKSRGARGEK